MTRPLRGLNDAERARVDVALAVLATLPASAVPLVIERFRAFSETAGPALARRATAKKAAQRIVDGAFLKLVARTPEIADYALIPRIAAIGAALWGACAATMANYTWSGSDALCEGAAEGLKGGIALIDHIAVAALGDGGKPPN